MAMQPETPPTADAVRVAQSWARAIRGTSFVTMTTAQFRDFLRGLVERLLAEPADAAAPRAVGQALVAAHFTQVESLERSMVVLASELPPARVAPTLAGLAAGYADALRELTRIEQERITFAALTAREEAEEARSASEARLSAVFAEAPIGICVSTLDGTIIEVNGRLCEMFGYSREDFLRLEFADFQHPADHPGTWERIRELLAGRVSYFRVEKPYHRADGSLMWTDLVMSLIREKNGKPPYMLAMLEDITDRHDLHARLSHQALHDPLTGLPNRTLLFDRLETILATARPTDRIGLCYLDLDGFKTVNDTLGHDAGDELIRAVAARLADLVSTTTMVARTGGDEFVLLVEGPEAADTVALAERVLAVVRTPVVLRGQSRVVSACVGVVDGEVGTATAAELMKAADTTLYRAKSQGRNQMAQFDADRHTQDVTRFELTNSLPDALAGGEFFLEYQPLIWLRDDRLVGVEALVRWRHPRWGTLGPDRFISLAEQTGLIDDLGLWVLTQAVEQAASWRAEFPERPVMMSVNLAPHQVKNPRLLTDLAELLSRTGVPPELIQLELTESAVMANAGVPLATLHGLAALGCRIAIDDFGTGYSNLAYLRTLPVHAVKLAGPFVAGLRGTAFDPADRAIVDTLIQLAHTLDLSVTAEGVESETQASALRALHCDLVQGYLYSTPVGPDAIHAMLAKD